MPDTILLPAIKLQTHIGVPDDERAKAQTIIVSVEMELDASKAGESDDINDTIDYEAVTQDVLKMADEERKTIEKLTEDIAQMILKKYQPDAVTVSVRKKVPVESNGVTLTITRQ